MTLSDEILLQIHESYYNNFITENEYDQLLYEFTLFGKGYTLDEKKNKVVRTTVREFKSVADDIIEEWNKTVSTVKNRKKEKITISHVGQISGVVTAIGIQIAMTCLIGGADMLLNAATAVAVLSVDQYNFSFMQPIKKTTVKPFLDSIFNRHQGKAESIVETAKSLQHRIRKLNQECKNMSPKEFEKKGSELGRNIVASAREIDKFKLKIQRDLKRLEEKIQEQKNIIDDNKKKEVSNQLAYDRLNNFKVKQKNIQNAKKYLDDNLPKDTSVISLINRYGGKYKINEPESGNYTRNDILRILKLMRRDNSVPVEDKVKISKYIYGD